MLGKRIIPCLDMTGGKVRKGIRFDLMEWEADPPSLAAKYSDEGADEITFLDITASSDAREILIDVVKRTAENVFIPFCVGGGIRKISDIREILLAGADKVSINTSAVKEPDFINEGSRVFGAQCIVCAIDVKRRPVRKNNPDDKIVIDTKDGKCWYEVVIEGGRTPTGLDAIQWGMEAESRGAGEILLTSMDEDGVKQGYDLAITREFSERLSIPVIASGGCGNPDHIVDAFNIGKADAALAASIFHFNEYSIMDVKDACKAAGIPIRT
ncbi:MAG TPA: imidazole glycerol phosphate synthase subunit HisF [Candidatus Lokiarchaeia archaeon]|nr:imidazole glycerol phosphate synthase subunit HisF [Candidatus Lokiarchaeia archaeon]